MSPFYLLSDFANTLGVQGRYEDQGGTGSMGGVGSDAVFLATHTFSLYDETVS